MPGVRTTHADYDKFAPKWKRVRDVVAGTDAVHAAGKIYLPKLMGESDGTLAYDDNDYKARVNRSDFFNGTWRTMDALGGMAFRKPPTVDVPAGIETFLQDINLAGMTMESLAKECTEEVLGPGRVGILIDHPPVETDEAGKVVPITKAVAEQRGMRPTMQLYMTESIRNWKFERVNNAWVLTQIVLGECAEIPKDEFTVEEDARYRVLDLDGAGFYRQRLFKVENEKDVQIGGDLYPLMNGKPLDFIPFVIIGTCGRNDNIDEPPLIDLVDANLALYQINSIYRHTLYFCPPTFYISGYTVTEGQKITVGGTSALIFPDPNAKAAYAEPEGNMVPALRDAMSDKKQEMALLGARMIADETNQVETLGATQIKRAGENSVLSKIVQSVSEALEWALGVFAEWAGSPGEIVYQINRDFMPAMMDAPTLLAIFAGVQSGNISKRECFDLLQRGDVIDGDVDYEEHQGQVEVETPTPARPAVKPGEAAAA